MESVDKLREELLAAVEAAVDLDALEQVRITALGKKVLDDQYNLRTNLYKLIPGISFNG